MNDQMKRPRGRPRPQETIERDAAILELLQSEGAMTRNQLSERTGVDKVKVYLALDRLRTRGLVRTCTSAAPGQTLWSSAVGEPCP